MEGNIERKMQRMRSLGELPSAAPGTREGSGMPLVGAGADIGTGTRKGQGVKTEVAEPSNNCSSIIGRIKKEVERLKAILGITPATQQAMQPCDEL